MTAAFAAGAAGAEGVSWLDVAASGSGISESMKGIGTGAAQGFASAFNDEIKRVHFAIPGFGFAGDMATLGFEAAQSFTGQFTRVLQGSMPDPKVFFDTFQKDLNTVLDDTIGRIPLVGSAFRAMWGSFEPIAGDFIDMSLQLGETLEQVGAQWTGFARTFAATTLDVGQITNLLGVTRQVAESGTVSDLNAVADSIGLINTRISGLNNQQLAELGTTMAAAGEIFGGQMPNVNLLTQALAAFDVQAGDANTTVVEFVNAAVASGQPIDQMLSGLVQMGPALREMGYDAEQSAEFLGELTKSGEPMSRLGQVFNQAVVTFRQHGIEDVRGAWRELIGKVRQDIADGNEQAASELLRSYGVSSRGIPMLLDEIKQGGAILPEELTAAQPLGNLNTDLDRAKEATGDLRDKWAEIGTVLSGVLAPLGLGLEESLIGMSSKISSWIADNKTKIIGWAGEVGHWVITGMGDIFGVVATTLKLAEPFIHDFFVATTQILTFTVGVVHDVLQALTNLPFGAGDKFKPAAEATGDMYDRLNAIRQWDISAGVDKVVTGLQNAQTELGKFDTQWTAGVGKAQYNQALTDAFSATYAKPGQDKPQLQLALDPDTREGLKLLGDPATFATAKEELAKLGIHMDIDEATGKVKSFVTDTEGEADTLKAYLTQTFGKDAGGKDLAPQVSITVAPSPPMSNDEARAAAGLPSAIPVPIVPGPPPPLPPVTPDNLPGILGIPGQPVPPGQVTPGPIQIAPGVTLPVHPSGYVEIPGQVTIHAASFNRSVGDVMDSAGIPPKLQGDVPGASPGVLLPTGLDVTDAPTPKTVRDVMTAAGVPDVNQTDTGVLLDVGFSMPAAAGGGGGAAGGVSSVTDAALLANVQPGTYLSEPGVGDLTKGIGDCSSAVEDLVDILQGRSTAGRSLSTGNAPEWLTAHGFLPTEQLVPGALNVGFNAEHMQATLPGGTNFNWGSGDAAARGGVGGTGAFDPAFTQHYYLPASGGAGSGASVTNVGLGLNWDALAGKESGGDWSINTGTKYSGGLQFDQATWEQYGGTRYAPHAYQASRDQQIAVAQQAYDARGGGSTLWPTNYGQLGGGDRVVTAAGYTFPADFPIPGGGNPGFGNSGGGVPTPLGTAGGPPGVDMSKIPAFTPGQAPYNPYTNPPPWPMTQKDQQDFKRSFDQWLISVTNQGDAVNNATDQQNNANDQKQKADDALTQAQQKLTDFLNTQHLQGDKDYDETDPNSKISQLRAAVAAALDRQKNAAEAQARAAQGITRAQQQQYISGETPPPTAPGQKDQKVTPDKDASQLGAGLVKGIFQELGFPDVFGKAFTNWGAWKLGMGGLGYGMNLLDAMANPQGASGGGSGGGGGLGSGLAGLLHGALPGLPLGTAPGGPGPAAPAFGPAAGQNLFGGPTGAAPGPPPAPGPGLHAQPSAFGVPAPPGPGTPTVHTAAAHQPDPKPGANWIPGGLNPGLHMAGPAAMIQGSGFETFAAGFLGGIPNAASVVGALSSTHPPREEPPPAANGGGANLNINYDQRGSWQPTPQMRDDVHAIASTTSAPQTAGGAGLLV